MEEIIAILEKSFAEISMLIRNQNSLDLGDLTNASNHSGDDVKELDMLSNSILKHSLEACSLIRNIGSEEEDALYATPHTSAPYLVCYDPLDGSSNVDVNITTGTIFAVYQYGENGEIENGRSIVLSGYCLYGGSTQYVMAKDNRVSMFQYNSSKQCFDQIRDHIRVKEKGSIYSLNEANARSWCDDRYAKVISTFINQGYSARWVGSMVADAHRTLIKGGFFAYPANEKNKEGKIRLLYEAYPFAHIFEVAGGLATNGITPLLDIPYPSNLHQKTPVLLSGPKEHICFELSFYKNK